MINKILIFLFCCWVNFAFAALDAITTATLANGLKIVVKIDRRAPVFISQLWYKVGSADEKNGITGISHILEHMMFKGTKQFKAGEFSRIIARNGGRENAFTSKDFTAYYQQMHKDKLALSLRMEADRMGNLLLNHDEFEKERAVVIEERRLRVEDKPNAKVMEQLRMISFAAEGAYHAPVIGFQRDLEGYHLSDLQTWYEKYYAPNNATLVVVGDVNPQQVISLAKKYFAHYPANAKIDSHQQTKSIPLKGNSKVLKLKAKLPFYVIAFASPSLRTTTDEKYAYGLEMSAYVLADKLQKTLIRQQQIAASINVSYNLYDKYDTLFTIYFTPANGVDNATILAKIKQQIAELMSKPELIKADLHRIKAQIEADFVYQQDKISTQSYYLGMLSTVGLGIDKLFDYVDKMNAIDAPQVSAAVQRYLLFAEANSVELVPQAF